MYNMGLWDIGVVACVNVGALRTLTGEAAAGLAYPDTGRSWENGGGIGEPHIVVERCLVSLCILHYYMAFDHMQVAFIEARLSDLPKENTPALQHVLYGARTGVKLGAVAPPHGREAPYSVPRVERTWATIEQRSRGQ